ncbi:MAG: aminotransferase class I/II-fold pyridoxal phosphate-dependent enzyme [Mangrovibacterium sp.]
MITGHGDDRYEYPDIHLNFSSNINPAGTNKGLVEHLKNCLPDIKYYPDPLAGTLARRIEEKRNLTKGSVLITNGAVEAFYLLAASLSKKRSLVYIPSFAEYTDACRAFKHDLKLCDHRTFPDVSLNELDAVWIGNPNNPDGKLFDIQVLLAQITDNPDTLFIVDEAYAEFTLENNSIAGKACHLPNLAVVCSLTKRYAIPGIRLGYLVSHPARVNEIQQHIMPWRINSLAIEAGMFCLSEKFRDEFDIHELLKESKRVQAEINKIKGFKAEPSETLFFLVKGPVKTSYLKQMLARDHKILIRDASNFPGLSGYHFRISIQTPEENDILIRVLKEWN